MESILGQLAAIGAAIAFSITSTSFTLAGHSFRPSLVMAFSVPISGILIIVLHFILMGTPFPFDAAYTRWFWLGASGVVGFWLASVAIVNAFTLIGPRLTLLITSVSPILSAILAYLFLGEDLKLVAVLGIFITVVGVVWVILDKDGTAKLASRTQGRDYKKGILFALVGAVGQATSLILAKQGLSDDLNPISGGLIRTAIASIVMWIFIMMSGQVKTHVQLAWSDPGAFRILLLGTIAGPFTGATLLLIAVQNAPVGVANTLTNLTPILLIPISYVVFHERISSQAIMGTFVAIIGIAILFLS